MSVEDAEIELGVEEFKLLLSLKIIEVDTENGLVIKFLDDQYKECLELGNKRSKAAKARWSKANQSKSMQLHTSGLQDYADKNREEENREEEKEEETVFQMFNRFWDLYDKKMDKVKCEIEWSNIDSAEYAKIIDHVPKFVKASGQYLCKPINYLTGRRWQDEELPNYGDNKQPKEQKLVPYTPKPPVH